MIELNPTAEDQRHHWARLIAVLAIGLYIRLMLAFSPGFASDTNWMVNYVSRANYLGVTSVTDIWDHTLYPPVFVYQALIASKVVSHLSKHPIVVPESQVTAWDRFGVRIIPILSDVVIAGLLFIFLAPAAGQRAALFGCSLYLFNPGTVLNSALWNYDAIPSLLILLTVILVGISFNKASHWWLILASGVLAVAVSAKLQAAMFLPAVAVFLLLTKNPRTIIAAAIVFLLVTVLAYIPFLVKGRWEYLERVFLMAFREFPVTHVNAYNLWSLGYQMPVTKHLLGVSLENIGRLLYFAAAGYSIYALLRNSSNGMHLEMRQVAIFSAYLCLAPFLLLTRMHERYLAPAIALVLFAGFLDRRLRIVGCGFALTYALNMIAVILMVTKPWLPLTGGEEYPEPLRLAFLVNRIFCSLSNVLLFGWFTLMLRSLFSTTPDLATASHSQGEPLWVSAGSQSAG